MRAKLPHTEGDVPFEGTAIHYEIYGEGEHTILFLPSWSIIHSRVYKGQIPYFADRFRVIAYDPPGNGKSGRPDTPAGYGVDALVSYALGVMDATGTEKAILVGLSWGGYIASQIVANHPERVEALISIGGNVPHLPGSPNWGQYDPESETHEGWQKADPRYWTKDYPGFTEFFLGEANNDPHSTKQLEDAIAYAAEGDGEMLAMTWATTDSTRYVAGEELYRKITCPVLAIHGDNDVIVPVAQAEALAAMTGGECVIIKGGGHSVQGRFPARVNTAIRDFLARHLGTWRPEVAATPPASRKRALYLSSPIGLGHARRDLAITRELRALHPELTVDWLAQDPVTRFLMANNETVHPASGLMASESAHIEMDSGEHELHVFKSIRNMDEVLIKNFMVFQEAVEAGGYDLVIADEAWDVDHYWHEHPDLKTTSMAWFTDYVGYVPMPEGGEREAFLTADYNQEMIEHVERSPEVRDRAIFVGNPADIVPLGFGNGLPAMRDWVPKHFDFAGYIIGEHPGAFGSREDLRAEFGYRPGEKVCIVTVGGSGVGAHLIRRIIAAYPAAKAAVPELRMIVVTGPRLDPAIFGAPAGIEFRAFVPNLDRHLACCDLALVQGGLTTCMELAAAGTPFLYFPLRNHFEQNVHVAHRLETYNAGRRMMFAESSPEAIAAAMTEELSHPRKARPVEAGGAKRAAAMLADLL